MQKFLNLESIHSHWIYIFDSNCPMSDWMDELFAFTTGLGHYAPYLWNFQDWYLKHCQVIQPPKNAFDDLYEINEPHLCQDQTLRRPYTVLPTPYSRVIDIQPFFLLYSDKETPEEVFAKIRADRVERLEQKLQLLRSLKDDLTTEQKIMQMYLSRYLERDKNAQLKPSPAAHLSGGFFFMRCPTEETQRWIRLRCVSFFELLKNTPEYRNRLLQTAGDSLSDIRILRFRLVQQDAVQRTLNVCPL